MAGTRWWVWRWWPRTRIAPQESDFDILVRAAPGGADAAKRVRIVVDTCIYNCCGRITPRSGYEQTYEGIVLSVSDDGFNLGRPNIGGRMGYIVTSSRTALVSAEVIV